MKWNIWVDPNQIFEEEYPNDWTQADVLRAANNRYGGKVTTVSPAPIGGSTTNSSSINSSNESSGGTELVIWLIVTPIKLSYYAIKATIQVIYQVITKGIYPALRFIVVKAIVPTSVFIGTKTYKIIQKILKKKQ